MRLLNEDFLNYINLFLFYIIFYFVGCSDCSNKPGERWKFIRNDNVGIEYIVYDDTITVEDSLYIEIFGMTIEGDKYNNLDLEVDQNNNSVLFGLYADTYYFNGCGVMPPTDISPYTETILLPPFSVGELILIDNQKSNLDTLGIVTIKP